MNLRLGPSSSLPRFTAWLCLGICKPSTSSSHLRLHYNSGRVAPGKTQIGADLALHSGSAHPVNSYRSLQTTSEHDHPIPAHLILQRAEVDVNGHSQILQLPGRGKFLPLICQQQPSFNYKKQVYSAHTKGMTRVPSLGDRGGCTTGHCRTPTRLAHTTKTQNQNIST